MAPPPLRERQTRYHQTVKNRLHGYVPSCIMKDIGGRSKHDREPPAERRSMRHVIAEVKPEDKLDQGLRLSSILSVSDLAMIILSVSLLLEGCMV